MPAKKMTANDVISKRLRYYTGKNRKTAEHGTDSREQVGTAVRHHECRTNSNILQDNRGEPRRNLCGVL